MSEPGGEAQSSATPEVRSGPGFLIFVGLILSAAAIVGTLFIVTEMADDGFGDVGYSTVDKWLAGLAGITATGAGVVVIGVGMALSRMDERRRG